MTLRVALACLLVACAGSPPPIEEPAAAPVTAPHADRIRVASPAPGALVTSPLRVTGEARGSWYFEADFPLELLDSDGNVLARHYARARGEWMTNDFVPFEGELPFTPPATPEGALVLRRANASGLPEHDAELRVRVRFAER